MNIDEITKIVLNAGWGGDFSPDSEPYNNIRDILRNEYNSGHRMGLERAFDELDEIFGSHLSDEPHRGIVALVLDLAKERLDLR